MSPIENLRVLLDDLFSFAKALRVRPLKLFNAIQ